MNKRERESLDRHITGNYGEGQFKDEAEDEDDWEFDGICPICGKPITLELTHRGSKEYARTNDGRLIGSCKDAFTDEQWESPIGSPTGLTTRDEEQEYTTPEDFATLKKSIEDLLVNYGAHNLLIAVGESISNTEGCGNACYIGRAIIQMAEIEW